MASESVGSCAIASPFQQPQSPKSPVWEEKRFVSPNTPDRSRSICYSCNQEGHWSVDCPHKTMKSPAANVLLPNHPHQYPELTCTFCGHPCVVRTSRTDNNPNRDFYTCDCRRSEKGSKQMFQWCDELGKTKPHGINSPVKHYSPPKPDQQHGATVSKTPICICTAGPCRVETKQGGPFKGRKYFACHLKKGQGPCIHFEWCEPCEDKKGKDSNKLEDIPIPTYAPEQIAPEQITPSTTPRAHQEANYVSSRFSPMKTPNSPEGSPSKRKHIEQWLNESTASPTLAVYVNDAAGNNNTWLVRSPMKRLNLNDRCVVCGGTGHGVNACVELAMYW